MPRVERAPGRVAAWLGVGVGVGVVAAMAAPVAATAAPAGFPARETVTFRTLPAIAGVRIRSAGQTVRTDGTGFVTLTVRRTGSGYRDLEAPKVLATRLPSGKEARFGGLFQSGRTIGISLYTRASLRFVDLAGQRVPARRVTSARLASRNGARIRVEGGVTPMLQASRVLLTSAGVQSRPIAYGVESVEVDGANVVYRDKHRFFPLRTARLRVPLLLYSARFVATDALFGDRAGAAVLLRYPSGRTARIPLRDGTARAVGLPRGQYQVRVDAPGYSFERPLWLSRDQVVDLPIVSYLDLAVVFGGLASLALGLLLVGRPLLRRRLRRVAAVPRRRARTAVRR
jgi:hypothetical protein